MSCQKATHFKVSSQHCKAKEYFLIVQKYYHKNCNTGITLQCTLHGLLQVQSSAILHNKP